MHIFMPKPSPPPAGPPFVNYFEQISERPQPILKKRSAHSLRNTAPIGVKKRSPVQKRVRLAAMDTIPVSDITDRDALKEFLYEGVSISNNVPSPAQSRKRPAIITTPSPARPPHLQLSTPSRPSLLRLGFPTSPRSPLSPRSPRNRRKLSRRKPVNPEGLPEARKVDEAHTPSSVKTRVASWLLNPKPEVVMTRRQSLRRDIDSPWVTPTSSPNSSPASQHSQDHLESSLRVKRRDLVHRLFSNKELCWDVRDAPSMARIVQSNGRFVPMQPSMQAEAALCPNISVAEIHLLDSRLWNFEHKWGSIILRRTDPRQPIAVWHILEAIYTYFHYPISQGDLAAFAPTGMDRELVEENWRQRTADFSWAYGSAKDQIFDPKMRRVDLLGSSSRFWKLRLGSMDTTSCQLFLSLR
ncbi:hypothetical protein CPB83DRAFT_908846 [Crepidotus variabilis]|uniref:DUF6699 domain-containing protein n=1 Tax=Crepidotus variabilis TaxID=179855 RepID=A0A9P6EB77_9AGAR|nr:hypothetical protein CPB83DRAFT_908846 [Crepidotus variabilis]